MTSGNGFSDFFYPSRDGLRLHARIYGEAVAGRWPVICLAGLTRNAQDFHELALFLSQRTATAAAGDLLRLPRARRVAT